MGLIDTNNDGYIIFFINMLISVGYAITTNKLFFKTRFYIDLLDAKNNILNKKYRALDKLMLC